MATITFTRCAFAEGDTLTPLAHVTPSTFAVPDEVAAALEDANALPLAERLHAQADLLAEHASTSVYGFAYDHPFTVST